MNVYSGVCACASARAYVCMCVLCVCVCVHVCVLCDVFKMEAYGHELEETASETWVIHVGVASSLPTD